MGFRSDARKFFAPPPQRGVEKKVPGRALERMAKRGLFRPKQEGSKKNSPPPVVKKYVYTTTMY